MRILSLLFVLALASFAPIWSTKKNSSTTTSLPRCSHPEAAFPLLACVVASFGLHRSSRRPKPTAEIDERGIALLEMARHALHDLSWHLKSSRTKILPFAVGEK